MSLWLRFATFVAIYVANDVIRIDMAVSFSQVLKRRNKQHQIRNKAYYA